MLHDLVHPTDQPHLEHASSPLSDQILEFCESDLFIQNSNVTSVSNYCYEEQSSYVPPDMINYATATTTSDVADANFTVHEENDISTHLDFTNLQQYSFSHQDEQYDLSLLQNHISLTTDGHISPYPHPNDQTDDVLSLMGPMVCENEFLSMPLSKCMRLNNPSSPSTCFLDHPYLASGNSNPILQSESCGVFDGNLSLSNEIQDREIDLCGDIDGIFYSDPLLHPYNSNDQLQVLSDESQHLINNGGGCCNPPLAPPEIASLESVPNKLTSEERREKIHRYMKKRNERNFSKKIKYACRKTLADSRPRVRGRFAKNEGFGDHHRTTHEEDTDEDVVVKEEEKVDSSDIFAHISSLNSLRCNYPIQSWI